MQWDLSYLIVTGKPGVDLSEWLQNSYEWGGKMLSFHSTRILFPLPIQSFSIWISFFRGQFRPYTFVNSLPLVFWSGAECNQSSVFTLQGWKWERLLSFISPAVSLISNQHDFTVSSLCACVNSCVIHPSFHLCA